MSQYPSSPVPPPPPGAPPPGAPPGAPPGGSGDGPRIPWEDRDQLGFAEALVETLKLLVTAPADAFARLRADGDYIWPLVFGLIFSWIGQFFSQFWSLLMGSAMQSMMGGFGDYGGAGTSILSAMLWLIFWPILYAIIVFIMAGILHLSLMIVGGTNDSPTGFEGTFKVATYSSVAALANIVPVIGGLIALVGSVVLWVIGFVEVHKTSQGRAVAGALIPIGLCCLCVIMMVMVFGVGLAAILAGNAAS